MSDISEIAKFVAGDVRYGITIISAFVLGLILLFLKELKEFCPFVPECIVPALIVYTIGTAIIGHIQILITVSTNTKAQAAGKRQRGIHERHLCIVLCAHGIWFGLFLAFIIWRAVG